MEMHITVKDMNNKKSADLTFSSNFGFSARNCGNDKLFFILSFRINTIVT